MQSYERSQKFVVFHRKVGASTTRLISLSLDLQHKLQHDYVIMGSPFTGTENCS